METGLLLIACAFALLVAFARPRPYARLEPEADFLADMAHEGLQVRGMDISEFREFGYLQELNRCFLHPLGLALEVVVENGKECLGGIWDYRADPEGLRYGIIERDKYERVAHAWTTRKQERMQRLGYFIQPPPGSDVEALSDRA